jgi:hypothetical protein
MSIWRNAVGTALLLAAVLIHLGQAFWSIYRRRHLRMPVWQALQLGLGVCIPLLLVNHAIGTRGASTLYDYEDSYTMLVLLFWELRPDLGLLQSVLVVVAWAHGCIGIHYWLRIRGWYNRIGMVLYTLAILLPVWGCGAVLWFAVRVGNPLALAFLDLLPAIGGYRKHQALADFAFALGNLLEAGAPIGEAWRDAGKISRSPRLLRAAGEINAVIESGLAPGPRLEATRVFPPEFVARYQTGETTGSLEASLLALATDHQARANQRLTVASMLYPGLLFGVVALMVAWFVISFYMSYIGTLNHLMEGM